jgi:hypothetical protein
MSKISSRSRSPRDLWYPSLIIALSSSTGQELFSKSFHIAYDLLNPHFEPQERIFFCGVACATILLNTLLPSQKWNQSSIYSTVARSYMLNGITLANLSYVLEVCGLSSIIRYCENEFIEEQFREDLKQENHFIIVNYWRQFDGKEKDNIHCGGHFSLIGGFNETTDDVLILDTSQRKFSHHWLSLKDLVRMMCTYDRMASMARGYLCVIHPNDQFKFHNQNQND